MKRITNRKSRLGFTLKFFNIAKNPQEYHRQIKSRVLDLIKANSAQNYYIKVTYGQDLVNEGSYTTKKGLIFALNAFTEKSLLDYIGSDGW